MFPPWIFSHLVLIGVFHAGGAVMCGSVARKGQFKYVVEIMQTDNGTFLYCTGAIIDPSHILTAAHCVLDNIGMELSIIAGTVNLRSRSLIERKVVKVYIHEKFTFEGRKCGRWGQFKKWFRRIWNFIKNEQGIYKMQNDIAVLRLDKALPLGNNIEIVSLPTFGFLPYCEHCEYAGWGDVDEDGTFSMRLRWMNMLILTPQDCNDFNARHYPNQFCAIHPERTSCPLSGDSGAPLVYRNTVFGVTSNGCGAPESPTIFSNVFDHLDFIRKALTN